MCSLLAMAIQRLLGLAASPSRDAAIDRAYGLFGFYGCKQTLG